jgi:beta-aspartyl-peptidase (threonine type)
MKISFSKVLYLVCCCIFLPFPKLSGQDAATGEQMDQHILESEQKWVLVIHGGAGGPAKGTLTGDQEKRYLLHLDTALQTGASILSSGGSSLDAVEAVVRYMEDCPLFNAGKGAVLNADGNSELDAAIMDGNSGKAGAVASVKTVKNPISAARKVMETTPHVMLAGVGADIFAKKAGLETVPPEYFITPERTNSYEKWKNERKGTVGAVARDIHGNLAAATSTGGMTGKLPGRVGDTPVIGAGTYANNRTCAVSATGHGEFFIRQVVAYDLSAQMEYTGKPLDMAADELINKKLKSSGGSGGLIAVDSAGNMAMPFNTNAMFRGYIRQDGSRQVMIY